MEEEGAPSDDEGASTERELEALENDDTGFGDEEPDVDEDSDEVAADVAASDAAAVEGIIEEADLDGCLTALSAEDSKIAKLSIAKVRAMSLPGYLSTYVHLQLRALAQKIVHSSMIKEDLVTCCEKTGIKPVLMIRDVPTRWNSTAALIQQSLDLKPVLKVLVIMKKYNKARGVRLMRFQLREDEWAILEEVAPLLNVRVLGNDDTLGFCR